MHQSGTVSYRRSRFLLSYVLRAIIYEKAANFQAAAASAHTASTQLKVRAEDHADPAGHTAVEGQAALAVPPRREEPKSVSAVRGAWNLTWPPVLPDHSIPIEDGFDMMPLLGIKVPRFWSPPVCAPTLNNVAVCY